MSRNFMVTVTEERTCDRCGRMDTARGTSEVSPSFGSHTNLLFRAASQCHQGILQHWSRPDNVDLCFACTQEMETWWRKVHGLEPLFVGRGDAPPADAPPAGVERGVGATPPPRPTSIKRVRTHKVIAEVLR